LSEGSSDEGGADCRGQDEFAHMRMGAYAR
jgi:hypothetical protein